MNLVSISGLSKTVGAKTLFSDISFGIDEGDKIAIIGVNGSGKSTLLRIIAGLEIPDSGDVVHRKDLRISCLSQNPDFNPDHSIGEHIYKSDSPIIRMIKKYESLLESHEDDEALETLRIQMEQKGAFRYESEIRSILHALGIRDMNLRMGELSGGMLKKVALAQTIIEEKGILILDEPTNHLDMDTIQWLEEFLLKTYHTVIMVTHDRYFLDNVVNRIFEIDQETLFSYSGSYNTYLEKKSEYVEGVKKREENIKRFLKSELEWLKRQPQARGTKQKARIDRIQEAKSVEKYRENADFDLSVTGRRLGKKILELKKISKRYDDKLIMDEYSYSYKSGERLGIVGPNGSGKTTFLNILAGRTQPDSGEVAAGINTVIGYFDQMSLNLKEDQKVIDFIKDEGGSYIDTGDGRRMRPGDMLEYFLFTPDQHYAPIGRLSGGEKRRLYLISILMRSPNFLILDEPTNDLDIKTLTILEEFLQSFNGCIMVVSHDRFFLDRTVDSLLVFDGSGRISGFPGNSSDYLEYLKEENRRKNLEKKSEQKSTRKSESEEKKKTKLSYNEKRELTRLEKDIERLEEEKKELESLLNSGGDDYNKLAEWGERHKVVSVDLEKSLERWETLASYE